MAALLPGAALAILLVFLTFGAPGEARAQIGGGGPSWSQLSPAERQVLAPLASDWDRLDSQRKQKWRGIAQQYGKMSPTEQQRIQHQMKSWAELTPQQRQTAREQYKSLRQLPPDQKSEVRQRWEEYQTLTPDQKRELAERNPGNAGKSGAVRPPVGQRSAPSSTGAPAAGASPTGDLQRSR